MFENIDFREDFQNTSILIKLSKSSILDKIFERSSVEPKFSKYLDFGQNLEKTILDKIFEVSILVKIFEIYLFW